MIVQWWKERAAEVARQVTEPVRKEASDGMLRAAVTDLAQTLGLDAAVGWVKLLRVVANLKSDATSLGAQVGAMKTSRDGLLLDLGQATKQRDDAQRQIGDLAKKCENQSTHLTTLQTRYNERLSELRDANERIVALVEQRSELTARIGELAAQLDKGPICPAGFALVGQTALEAARVRATEVERARDEAEHKLLDAELRARNAQSALDQLKLRVERAQTMLTSGDCDCDSGDRRW